MKLRVCSFGEGEDVNEPVLTLLLTSFRLPLPLSLILPPKHCSRHSSFISEPAVPSQTHPCNYGHIFTMSGRSVSEKSLSLKAVTAEDALHKEQ